MQPKKRLDYLDIVKALAIFFVIMGHVNKGDDMPAYRIFIYTFHMPLFFAAAGLSTKWVPGTEYTKEDWKPYLWKNFLALIVPYLIWSLIYSNFSLSVIPGILYATYETYSPNVTVGAMWYLPCFFIVRIYLRALQAATSRCKLAPKWIALISAAVSFVIGFLLGTVRPVIGFPCNIDVAFVALGFLLLGFAVKEAMIKLVEEKLWVLLVIMVVTGALFYFGTFARIDQLDVVAMYIGSYGNIFWMLYNGIFGSSFMLVVAVLLDRIFKATPKVHEGMTWLGQNTIGIYLLHTPILRQVATPLVNTLGLTSPDWLVGLIASAVTLPICCVLVTFINKYLYQLFGKFK